MQKHEAYKLSMDHMHRYVQVQMADGMVYDGIVEHVGDDHLYLAVPRSAAEANEMRQPPVYPGCYGPWGYPYPYGYYPYGYFPCPPVPGKVASAAEKQLASMGENPCLGVRLARRGRFAANGRKTQN